MHPYCLFVYDKLIVDKDNFLSFTTFSVPDQPGGTAHGREAYVPDWVSSVTVFYMALKFKDIHCSISTYVILLERQS